MNAEGVEKLRKALPKCRRWNTYCDAVCDSIPRQERPFALTRENQLMALLDCPECGHQVSDEADACPSCGKRLTDRLDRLEMETELNRIDLEWEKERKAYLGGSRARGAASMILGVIVSLGVFGPLSTIAPDEDVAAMIVGGMVLTLLIAFVLGGSVYLRGVEYKNAEAEYLQRRGEVEKKRRTTDDA